MIVDTLIEFMIKTFLIVSTRNGNSHPEPYILNAFPDPPIISFYHLYESLI